MQALLSSLTKLPIRFHSFWVKHKLLGLHDDWKWQVWHHCGYYWRQYAYYWLYLRSSQGKLFSRRTEKVVFNFSLLDKDKLFSVNKAN